MNSAATKETIRRWCQIWIIGLAATLPATYAVALLPKQTFTPPFIAVAAAILAVGIWKRRKLWLWLGFRHFLVYPPTWLAAVFGFAILLECDDRIPGVIAHTFIAIAVAANTLLMLLGVRRTKKRTPQQRLQELAESSTPRQPIAQWLNSDAPISNVADDRFNFLRATANQLIERLEDSTARTTILLGELGGGKSSLLEVVKAHDKNREHIVISLWPYTDTSAAISGILDALSNSVRRHIDAHELATISESYLEAIDGVLGPWRRLLPTTPKAAPAKQIKHVDRVLSAINIRLVLWIEDLERLSELQQPDATPDYARVEPLRALLNNIGQLQNVHIVLSTAATTLLRDAEKIADGIVVLPFLDREVSEAIVLDALHDIQTSLAPQFPVQPAQTRGRDYARAIALLCNTPRQLKFTLRQCRHAWSRLRGEIDFDDAMIATAIRHTHPEVFSHINSHLHELIHGSSESNRARKASEFASLVSKYMTRIDTQQSQALELGLDILFKNWRTGTGSFQRHQTRLQKIATPHGDYWNRIVKLSADTSPTDQAILAAIANWRSTGDSLFMEFLAGNNRSAIRFASALNAQDTEKLVAHAIKHDCTHGTTKDAFGTPGLTSVWLATLSTPHVKAVENALYDWLETGGDNINVVSTISYFFAKKDMKDEFVLPSDARATLRERIDDCLMRNFQNKPGALIEALKDSQRFSFAIAFAPERDATPNGMWMELRETFVRAFSDAPKEMAPHFAELLVDVGHPAVDFDDTSQQMIVTERYTTNAARLGRLFGSSLDGIQIPPSTSDDVNEASRVAALAETLSARTMSTQPA